MMRTRRALQTSAELARQRLEARRHALAIQEDSLANAAEKSKSEEGITSAQRARYEELRTKVDHLRNRYEQAYALILDTKVAQGDNVFLNIIEEPDVHVSFSNAYLTLMQSLAIAVAAAVALAFLLDSLDVGLRDPNTVEERLGVPYLQSIPRWGHALLRSGGREDGVVMVDQSKPGAATEVYRNLRGAVEASLGEEQRYAILITSPRPGDGKSLTASNLAVTFAWTGKKVLLVDGDLRRGHLEKSLGLVAGKGLSDVLSGDVPDWRSAVVATPHENLSFLSSGTDRRDAPELVRRGRLQGILDEFRETHDVVIIDSPPLGHVVETEVYASVCEGTLLVARFGKTRYADVRHAVRRLNGSRILGYCINAVETSSRRVAGAYGGEYRYDAKGYRRYGSDATEPALSAAGSMQSEQA